MSLLQQEFREKFRRSDALNSLKEISSQMSKADFIEFTYTAMKSAYDKNRVKAVEYMLAFHERDNPPLLMRIHLHSMLADERVMNSGKEMLRVLGRHFSSDFCSQEITDFIQFNGVKNRDAYKRREKEIYNILLEENLPKDNQKVNKKLKI